MRVSTPFLVAACILLTIGSLLALISRCCYSYAAIFAALLFTLGGLSVGVGVVWFISVVSEDFGSTNGRNTSWIEMYGYWYGWSLAAAGGAGVGALLAALLTIHAYMARHIPSISHVCEDALERPLLRCRSEGCLGGRSCTSDTLRTYLTNDSRRMCGRTCTHSQALERSPSIVDLTRSSTDFRQESGGNASMSNTTSDDENPCTIYQHQPLQHHQRVCQLSPLHNEHQQKLQNEHTIIQYHYQHYPKKQINTCAQDSSPLQAAFSEEQDTIVSQAIVESPRVVSQATVESPRATSKATISASNNISTPPTHSSSSPSSCSSSITGNHNSLQLHHQPSPTAQYQTLQHRPSHLHHNQSQCHHTLQHPHHQSQKVQTDQLQHQLSKRPILIRQSSVPARPPAAPISDCGTPTSPMPTPPSSSATAAAIRQSSSELPRLPALNTFTADYSKTLPLKEVRQMAVFNRGNGNRSATLSRPVSKLSSEV